MSPLQPTTAVACLSVCTTVDRRSWLTSTSTQISGGPNDVPATGHAPGTDVLLYAWLYRRQPITPPMVRVPHGLM
jgi:hypothetical protein